MAINPMQQQQSPDMLMAMMTDPRATPQQRMAAMSALNAMRGGANAPQPPQMTGDSTGVSDMDPAFMAAVRQEMTGQGPEAQPEIAQRQAAPEAPQESSTAALMSGAADASRVAAMAHGGAVKGYAEGEEVDEEDKADADGDTSSMAMLSMMPKSMRDAISKDVNRMSAVPTLTRQDKYMALLQAGLGTMAAASKPGAAVGGLLGAVGEGGLHGLSKLQDLRKQRALERMKSVAAESSAVKSAVAMLPYKNMLAKMKKDEEEGGGVPANGGGSEQGNVTPPFMDSDLYKSTIEMSQIPGPPGNSARQQMNNWLRYGYTGTDGKAHVIPGSILDPEYVAKVAGGNAAAVAASTPRNFVPPGGIVPVFGYPGIVGNPPGTVPGQLPVTPVAPVVTGINQPTKPNVKSTTEQAAPETPGVDPETAAIKTVMPTSPKNGGFNIETTGPTAEVDPILLEQKKASQKRSEEWGVESRDIDQGLNKIRAMANLLKLSQANPLATKEAGFLTTLNEARRQFNLSPITSEQFKPAAVQTLLKDSIDSSMKSMKGLNSRWTQSELALKMKSIINPENDPQTNFNVLVSTQAELEQSQDIIKSWPNAQKAGWKNILSYEENFRNQNPIDIYEESVARRTGNFSGMKPDFNRTAKGAIIVGSSGSLFRYDGKDENGIPRLTPVRADYLYRTPSLTKIEE